MTRYVTTRDLTIPAGTRMVHLDGRLVFGSVEPVKACPVGLSMGLDTALDRGLIEEAPEHG